MHRSIGAIFAAAIALLARGALAADAPAHDHGASTQQEVSCVPVAQRAGRQLGCYVLAKEDIGTPSSAPLYWHLLTYPTRAAAESAKGKTGSVVESYGKVWLLSIAEGNWMPKGGERVARVGPLPVNAGATYTAEYMEATFLPGMKSRVHRHPGPEAWYVLNGEQCLETPGHKDVVRAGESGIVPQGPPMVLWGTGTAERRALALILHDSSQPMSTPAPDWKPAGLCAAVK